LLLLLLILNMICGTNFTNATNATNLTITNLLNFPSKLSTMKPRSLSLLLPSSFAIDTADLRGKTAKIGQIARAASVFCVDRIVVYRDPDLDETKLIETILAYAETPQYLRRHIFPLTDDLRYAGALPPLGTPHHPLDAKEIVVGAIRAGLVVRAHDTGSWVDIGFERPAFLDAQLQKGERVNVIVTSQKPLKARQVRRDEIAGYWGYAVERAASLWRALVRSGEVITIATSKYGTPIDLDLLTEIGVACEAEDVLIVFGPPHKGIHEIMEEENVLMSKFNYVLNALPDQGTETVRVEEAAVATLAILNMVLCRSR